MTSLTEKEECKRGCTRWGAGIGLVAALLFWLVFGWGFFMSLILGIVLGLVAYFVLVTMWCNKVVDAPAQASAPAPAPAPAPAAPVSAAPESGSDATASADVGGAASEATAGTSAAAVTEKAAFSGVKPSKPLKGQEELAARKGSYKYEAPKAEKAATKKAAPKKAPAKKPAAPKKAAPVASADIPAAAVENQPETLTQPRAGGADDLKLISGVGPKLEQTLNELGFYHFDQIAKWGPDEITWVDARVRFKGRIQRDNWMAQAATLAAGGETEFSARKKKS